MILSQINASKTLARRYVERCCIKVEQDGKIIQAFTEYEGKMRVTDWGGTSSAIYLFNQIGTSGYAEFKQKLVESQRWLLSNQSQDGAWEAAEMYCCEATAAVLADLYNCSLLSKKQQEKAVNYILDCYVKSSGYFVSRPSCSQTPHLYTTYLAVKALCTLKHELFTTKMKHKIVEWVNTAKSADGLWGATSQTLAGDTVHTVFALLIICYCGVSLKELKKNYKTQINWLKGQIKNSSAIGNSFTYEATEVYENSRKDINGAGAYILKSYHFNLSLLCDFFLTIRKLDVAQRLIKKIIQLQGPGGGWGMRNERKEFVWATQQAVDCMCKFERLLFEGNNRCLSTLKSICYTIPYFRVKIGIVAIMLPVLIWLLTAGQKTPDVILSIITMIVPWLIKTED